MNLYTFLLVALFSILFSYVNSQTVTESGYLKQVGDTTIIIKDQYFRILDGDTINKIDEVGLLQGEWERLYPNGDFKCKGRYKNGKKDGYWERKYPNGNWQYQVNVKDGYSHGLSRYYYKNGKLKKEGNYRNGFPDGLITSYNENGSILTEENYQNVEKNGIKKLKLGIYISNVFSIKVDGKDTIKIIGVKIDSLISNSLADRSGMLKEDLIMSINDSNTPDTKTLINLTYSYQLDDSLAVNIRRNNQLIDIPLKLDQEDFETVKALLHGKSNYYDKGGSLLRSGTYMHGKRDKEWIFYSKEGKVITSVMYKNGTVITKD